MSGWLHLCKEGTKVEELPWQKLPPAPMTEPLDWSQPEGRDRDDQRICASTFLCSSGVKPCEGGSGGVALFKLPQGVVAVKPQTFGRGLACAGSRLLKSPTSHLTVRLPRA